MSNRKNSNLWLYFILLVFGTVTAVFLFVTCLLSILSSFGLIAENPIKGGAPLFLLLNLSILIGTVITIFVGRLIIKPIQNLSTALKKLSKGDFAVRVTEDARVREIREMSVRFNKMVQELSNIETLRNDFVVNVSHEFKTPLATIEGYATLLQTNHLSEEEQQHYIEKILDNSHRLAHMSGNILLLSKLENQKNILHLEPYRIDEQIREVVLDLETKWSEKKLELDIDLPSYSFMGNRSLLYHVWFNLIDNAIKYSDTGGTIRIIMETSDQQIDVSISDQGCGLSDEIAKHIFDKFYQGDRTRNADGNGLGLALVKRIVDLCDGTIAVNSREQEGTTFLVSLTNQME